MKKALLVLLAMLLLISSVAGCTQKTPAASTTATTATTAAASTTTAAPAKTTAAVTTAAATTTAAAPATTAPGDIKEIFGEKKINELNIVGSNNLYHDPDFNKILTWSEMERITGIHINWEYIPQDNLAEKKSIRLMADVLPDAFYGCAFSNADLYKYGGDGTFIDMLPYITPEITPNYYMITQMYESVRLGTITPEGKQYSFPTIFARETTELIAGVRCHVRKDWLATLGLNLPDSLDSFYEMLTAFANNDPNGNGKKDEYALSCYSSVSCAPIYGAFGLYNRGTLCGLAFDEDTQKVILPTVTENWKDYLIFMAKLWKEGLINHDAYTLKTADYVALATQEDRVLGVICGGGGPNIYGVGDEYEGAPIIAGYNGEKMHSPTYPELIGLGNFVVTYQSETPAQVLNWYDHIYSREGSILMFLGVEGVSYYVDKDGKNHFMDHITHNPDGLTFDQAVGKYVAYPGGYYCAMIYDGVFQGSEAQPEAYEAAQKVAPYFLKTTWPNWQYTTAENEVLSTKGTDLSTYITESTAKFITGEWDIDSQWEVYLAECKKIGLDEVLEIRQAAYNRYYGLN